MAPGRTTPGKTARTRAELEARLAEAEETLRALRSGEVDAIVVSGSQGERVFTLKGAERPYRRLVEAMSEGAATLAREGTILYCNRRFAELLGVPIEQVMGRAVRDHVSLEQLERFDGLFRSAWEATSKGEIGLRRTDGSRVAVHVSLSALEDEEPVLCLVATDLTEQIRAQELRISEQRAVSRAAEFEALLDAVPAAVFIARDREATQMHGNRLTYELLRLPEGTEVSKSAPLPPGNFRVLKDGVEVPPQELPVQLAAAQGIEIRSSELQIVFDDGTARRWIGNATPFVDESGTPNGAVGAFIDITERVRAEEALREADRRKNEFLGVLSHELRNPLAPIRNAIHILNRAPEGSDQAARAKAVIERQTNQLTRLVDDLLDVTRISRGKIQLRRGRVELTELVRQVVEDHRPIFASRNIALSLRIDAGPQWTDADAMRIAQVIGNLLQNAAKFTNTDGHVIVSVGQDGPSHAMIQVADDGIGITPEMLRHVFEAFSQADESLGRGGYGGLGLGLALVKGLVEMHDGRVEARSPGLGKGTEFTISLPLLRDAGMPLESPPTATAAAGRLRLLVIEDNLDGAETLKEILEMGGHEVAVAHEGQAGIATAHSFKPDVVLCDIGLPGFDGYEVARQIRADPSISPTLIALTGYTRPEDQRRAFKAGFDHHLGKPVQILDLERVLATITAHPTSRRILVVDDNDALRSNIRELLEDEGWEVREARDGKEAVEAVTGFDPAVMLLDYRLPEMDGGEVLRRLGAVHAAPRVVLMTASTQVREIAMKHGLRFYVPKPFRSDDLLDTVEHARSRS
jgi:PAS domain S-box-containing protein